MSSNLDGYPAAGHDSVSGFSPNVSKLRQSINERLATWPYRIVFTTGVADSAYSLISMTTSAFARTTKYRPTVLSMYAAPEIMTILDSMCKYKVCDHLVCDSWEHAAALAANNETCCLLVTSARGPLGALNDLTQRIYTGESRQVPIMADVTDLLATGAASVDAEVTGLSAICASFGALNVPGHGMLAVQTQFSSAYDLGGALNAIDYREIPNDKIVAIGHALAKFDVPDTPLPQNKHKRQTFLRRLAERNILLSEFIPTAGGVLADGDGDVGHKKLHHVRFAEPEDTGDLVIALRSSGETMCLTTALAEKNIRPAHCIPFHATTWGLRLCFVRVTPDQIILMADKFAEAWISYLRDA